MPIKDAQYYRSIDLRAAADSIRKLGSCRGSDPLFWDAIQALLIKAKEGKVSAEELHSILGAPDKEITKGEQMILEYNWINRHGLVEYLSTTPFVVRDGLVTGLADD